MYGIKTQEMRINVFSNEELVVVRSTQRYDTFTYLGSLIGKIGGTDDEVRCKTNKPTQPLLMQYPSIN